jgi:uncharacterized protein YceK
MFAADLPATAAADLVMLPIDLKTETDKLLSPSLHP